MEGLKKKIQQDLESSLKEKREFELSVLRMLAAVFQNKEKEKRFNLIKENPDLKEEELNNQSKLNDEEIIKVISSEIKKRRKTIPDYERGKRQDLADKEQREIEILKKYLPEETHD